MNYKTCIFWECPSNSKTNPMMGFADFVSPDFDMERAQEWVEIVNRYDFTIEDISENTFICEKHFPRDFLNMDYRTNPILTPFLDARFLVPKIELTEEDAYNQVEGIKTEENDDFHQLEGIKERKRKLHKTADHDHPYSPDLLIKEAKYTYCRPNTSRTVVHVPVLFGFNELDHSAAIDSKYCLLLISLFTMKM